MILILFTIVLLSGITMLYSSFALFSITTINRSVITIKVGEMIPTLKVDQTITNKITVASGVEKTFTVTLTNENSASGKFLLYYTTTLPDEVSFGYLKATGINTPPNEQGIILESNKSNTYSLKVSNYSSSSITISLTTLGGLSNQPLSLPIGAKIIKKYDPRNKNISHIYTYNASSCITGEEATCIELETAPDTYPVATIIKYKVNDTKELYFHVLADNGNTLTMQQQENTISKTSWYSTSNDNTKGPITVLPILE